MTHPPSKLGRPTALMRYAALVALFAAAGNLHAQTSGSNNKPPMKDLYKLMPISAGKKGPKDLPYKVGTSIAFKKTIEGDPEPAPEEDDIQWSADKGTPEFSPYSGASVDLDFGKPFIKEETAEARKVKVTATYTGPASVENSPQYESEKVKLTYLDFLVAGTVESTDDLLIVRDGNYVLAAADKKVTHWVKVLVKHSATGKLPLQLESSGAQQLYFYGEQNDPNQLTAEPTLEATLSKEYNTDEWFWIGTDAKGPGEGKFKAKGDLGTGFKEAPEEKTVLLLPVEVKVNDTDKEEDDLVAVSKGTDEDLATDFSVKVSGLDGLTAGLSIKGSDGDIKFKDQTLTLTNGVEAKTKLWGTSPSSDKDKTIIEITLKKDGKEFGKIEEEVTVIDGIKLTFSGTFCSPIDSINEDWRPGLRDLAPTVKNAPDDVINADSSDHGSTISFTQGDQPQQLRAHSPHSDVKITKVESISPPFELTKDPLNGANVYMTTGRFEHNKGAQEKIENPVLEFKNGGNSIFTMSVLNRADDTAIQFTGATAGIPVAAKIDAAAIAGDKLAKWLRADPPYNVVYVPNPSGAAHKDQRDFLENTLSKMQFKWVNSKFKAVAQSGIITSAAGKAIVGSDQKRGPEKTKLEFKLGSWDAWDLTGEITDGLMTTP